MEKARALNSVFQRQKNMLDPRFPYCDWDWDPYKLLSYFALFEVSSPDLHQLTLKRDAADRLGMLENHTKELLRLFTHQQWRNSVRLVSIRSMRTLEKTFSNRYDYAETTS